MTTFISCNPHPPFSNGELHLLEHSREHQDIFWNQFSENLFVGVDTTAVSAALSAYFGEEDDPLLWANLSYIFPNGMGILHFAAQGGQDRLIQRLLRTVKTPLLDQKGATHYHYLAKAGHVELLKDRGYSCMLKKDSEGLSVLDYALIHNCKEAVTWCSKCPDLFPEAAAMLQPLPITRETVPILRILHSGYFPEIASLEEISPLFTSLSKAVLSADSQPEAHLLPLYNKFCTILHWAQKKAKDPLLVLKKMEEKIQSRLNTAKSFIDTYPDLKERVFRDEFLWALLSYSEVDNNGRECLATKALCAYYGKEEGNPYALFPDGITPLHFAAAGGQKELLEKLLNNTQYNFRTLSKNGTPFEQYLVRGGHLSLVKQYIGPSELYNDFMKSLSSIAFIYNRREVLSYFAEDKGWPEAKLYLLLFDDQAIVVPDDQPFVEKWAAESTVHFITLISSLYSSAQIKTLSAKEIRLLETTFDKWVRKLNKKLQITELFGNALADLNTRKTEGIHIPQVANRLFDLQAFLNKNSDIINKLRKDNCLQDSLPLLRALIAAAFPNQHEGQFTTVRKKLGDGTFGTVYRVSKREVPAQKFALKIPDKKDINSIIFEFQRLNYLKAAATPEEESLFVHKIATCFTLRGRISLVLELCETSLHDALEKSFPDGMPIDTVQKIALQYVRCLQFLKKHGIVHVDLKPANTLIRFGGNFQIAVSDFGSSFALGSPPTGSLLGTTAYNAPEILAKTPPYGYALDMFSVGAIIVELITGKRLFPNLLGSNRQWLVQESVLEKPYPLELRDNLPREVANNIINQPSLRTILKDKGLNSSPWKHMLLSMLTFLPENRATPDDLLRASPLYTGLKRTLPV